MLRSVTQPVRSHAELVSLWHGRASCKTLSMQIAVLQRTQPHQHMVARKQGLSTAKHHTFKQPLVHTRLASQLTTTGVHPALALPWPSWPDQNTRQTSVTSRPHLPDSQSTLANHSVTAPSNPPNPARIPVSLTFQSLRPFCCASSGDDDLVPESQRVGTLRIVLLRLWRRAHDSMPGHPQLHTP
ncbi:hypothetical protein J1614_002929, partial [Plenodomus biglobosus]